MDFSRARDIVESLGVIEVLYQGAPVWIEQIFEDNSALVKYLDTNKRMQVPVNDLIES